MERSTIVRLRSPQGQYRLEVPSPSTTTVANVLGLAATLVGHNVALFLDAECTQPVDRLGEPFGVYGLAQGTILHVREADNDNMDLEGITTGAQSLISVTATTRGEVVGDFHSVQTQKVAVDGHGVKRVQAGQAGISGSDAAQVARRLPITRLDAVDRLLSSQVGTVVRTRDAQLCKHGDAGMCEYCSPLDPWDQGNLERNKIKHLSFHAYLRQQMNAQKTQAIDSKSYVPPLETPDISIKVPCPGKAHEPFPKGICTKCQPSSITLQSQPFRLVDHLEFENAALVDNFISAWRSSGDQRFGYLVGTYQPYSEVPLGCKAVVTAIYEPTQVGSFDGLTVELEDPAIDAIAKIAGAAGGQQIVGMIFTDLNDAGKKDGSVICKRHIKSYFMSSSEILMAAQEQLLRPTVCRHSPTGLFGSRFVTCIVSGNKKGELDLSTYQVSNMGMEMVRTGLIEATVEPSLLRVDNAPIGSDPNAAVSPTRPVQPEHVRNELADGFNAAKNIVEYDLIKSTHSKDFNSASIPRNFRPEVSYKFKNKYGLNVQEVARPTFPVDYLIVNASHGFPQKEPARTFVDTGFPIENRGAATNNTIVEGGVISGNENEVPTFKAPDFDVVAARIIMNAITEQKTKIDSIDALETLNVNQLSKLNDIHLLTYLMRTNIVPEDEFLKFVKLVFDSYVVVQKRNALAAVGDNSSTTPVAADWSDDKFAPYVTSVAKIEADIEAAKLSSSGRSLGGNSLKVITDSKGKSTTASHHDSQQSGIEIDLETNHISMDGFPGVKTMLSMAAMLVASGGSGGKQAGNSPGRVAVTSSGVGSSSSSGPSGQEEWQCQHCTFINPGDSQDCSMCGLPK